MKYMQAWEERYYDRQEAREEGWEEGWEEGREEGGYLKIIEKAVSKMKKGRSVEEIADALEEEPELIQRIVDAAETCEYNSVRILEMLKA